jgi:predicted SprT family Zn-dependent metalloprotease
MSVIAQRLSDVAINLPKQCKCGRTYDLIRTMLSVRAGKSVRMFECKACGDRTWDE